MVQSKAVMERNIHAYDEKWQLPEAPLMSAKAYKDKKSLSICGKIERDDKSIDD